VDGRIGVTPVVASVGVTSTQVVPLVLTCTFSPLPSAPLLPDTVSVVSLVMKSVDDAPVSLDIAVDRPLPPQAPWVSNRDGLAGRAAVYCRRCPPPALVGEARAVDRRVGIAPVRGVGRRDVDPGGTIGADLHLLAAAEHAIAAGYRQRGCRW